MNKNINIHLWFGSDDFSMQELVEKEKKTILEKNKNADICTVDFSSGESRFDLESKAMEVLRGNSLFSSDKLTIIKNLWSTQRKSKKSEDGAKEEEKSGKTGTLEDFLIKQMERIGNRDELFFLEERSLDKRSRAYKFFEGLVKSGKADAREFVMPIGFKFNTWLEERIKKQGGEISKSNLDFLAMLLGKGMEVRERGEVVAAYDLYQASSEIEKLISYCDGKEIGKDDILLLVSAGSDMNIFNLIESIGRHDRNRAISILSGQIREGYNENYILTMLVYHFRNLISVKSLLGEGMGSAEIARRTRIHPVAVEKSIGYLKMLSESQLVMIYEKLHKADLSMKTGKMEPELALDLIVAAI